jgi:hypothetical protein
MQNGQGCGLNVVRTDSQRRIKNLNSNVQHQVWCIIKLFVLNEVVMDVSFRFVRSCHLSAVRLRVGGQMESDSLFVKQCTVVMERNAGYCREDGKQT